MARIVVSTIILGLLVILGIEAHQCEHGHDHEDEKHTSDLDHDHGHLGDHHGHEKHSSSCEQEHGQDEADHDHLSYFHSHDHHSHDHDAEHSHTNEKELEDHGFSGVREQSPDHDHSDHHYSEHEHLDYHHSEHEHLDHHHSDHDHSDHGHSDLDHSDHYDPDHDHSDHHHSDHGRIPFSTTELWFWAMGCSLLVSLASLICLILLPLMFFQGKLSRTLVDGLAAFGAGSMLGDALLHQLPHAFGGSAGHSHGHDSHEHGHEGSGGHTHAHSLEDLRVGLAVLGGILLFFLVEKIVRRTEELSVNGGHSWGHSHHHHGHKKSDERITEDDKHAKDDGAISLDKKKKKKSLDSTGVVRKRNSTAVEKDTSMVRDIVENTDADATEKIPEGGASKLVLGYLNLFSDGVHNFNDGLALGSAFLLHGKVGGWSRTLFLLAHELPQEVGDFGILVRSGFSVFKALTFNFLSALVALAGTALALLVGGNPGHSALIEGFTAGGFIYIAVGAVMPDMHSQGNSLKTTLYQLSALSLGMGVAIVISLSE